MSEVEVVQSTELVLPTGEIVNLDDPASCAVALARVNELMGFLAEVKVTKTYDLQWDHHKLEEDLRAAGMPEERIGEIIVEEISYKVKAIEANKAAKANPEYEKAVEAARTKVEKRPTISLPRG